MTKCVIDSSGWVFFSTNFPTVARSLHCPETALVVHCAVCQKAFSRSLSDCDTLSLPLTLNLRNFVLLDNTKMISLEEFETDIPT